MNERSWKVALSLQASMVTASWSGVRLIMGYRALAMGADPFFLALLASSFALPALVVALPAGRLTDRIGGSVMATAGMLIAALGTMAAFLLPGLWALLGAAAWIGLGQILIMVGQQTFIANVSAKGDIDAAFGTLSAAASIGQLIGPPLVTTVASLAIFSGQGPPNTTAGLITCVALILLGTPAYFVIRRRDRALNEIRRTRDERPERIANLLRKPEMWRSLVVSGAILVSIDLMYAFVPVWATEQGIDASVVGWLLALRAGVSVVSRYGLNRLVNRFGRKNLIMVSTGAAAAGLFALPFVGVWGAAAVMVVLGFGLGIPQPLTMAWVASLTSPSSHGATLGMRLTSNRLAQVTLPLAVGVFAAPLGVLGIFWANAVLLMGAIGIMVRSKAGRDD